MTTSFLRRSLTLLLAAGSVTALHAQLPSDNAVWKTRCGVLTSAAPSIEKGATPAALVTATRGVAGAKFFRLAVDRSQEGQHQVACALFYLAAVADRAGNGGSTDTSAAGIASTLAAAEIKESQGQSLSFAERMAWARTKVSLVSGAGLTSVETQAVIVASTTMPLSLNPAPSPNTQMASNNPAKVR